MPGQRITEIQKRRFYKLCFDPDGPRLPLAAGAREVGISEATAYRLRDKVKPQAKHLTGTEIKSNREIRDVPAPLPYDQLGSEAKAALADINLFSEMFFVRRPSPWRYEAAMRAGELLVSGDREFIDVNVFPGIGKTTFWTHDLPVWLICGGFTEDPQFGRALRIMLGSRVMKVAKGFVARARRSLELQRPFWDKDQKKGAEFTLAAEYGRFKPDRTLGEESIWSQDQFLVAQMGDVDVYEKEPTVQAASQESGFLGERVNFAAWDDIAVTANSKNPDVAEATDGWFEDEAETRVEPGGLLALVGQRLGPLDLHRKRLDARTENDDGELVPVYKHLIFPAHHDELCDGEHRQWDPANATGCLTDAWRLPERDWRQARSKSNYRTVYQQLDSDPSQVLVQQAWLTGGKDLDGWQAPGCYDRDRSFHEWPTGVGNLVDYATLDPSAGNWWAMEWWAVQPETRFNYLIEGRRAKVAAGKFLDWDNAKQEFTGWMHEVTVKSYELGHPIRVWVIEANAAHKYLFQFEHFRRWRQAFPGVQVIAHTTGVNKIDPDLGVEGLLSSRYRDGMKRLPKAEGLELLNFMRQFEKELTTYPFAETNDMVMSDWIGEWNLDRIINTGRRRINEEAAVSKQKLPKYLERQQHAISL